jgi:hypothetical protein
MLGESIIIIIPADLIVLVRSGAYGDLHASLGELRGVIEACRNVGTVGQRYTLIEGCFARVDATRALLNLVGWTHFLVKGEVEVDLARHRRALRGALSARPADDTLASDLVIVLRALMAAVGIEPQEGERHGERRLTPEEFEQHFGRLPTDGEG